jgi:sialate O-acetylesterase
MRLLSLAAFGLLLSAATSRADVSVPAIFSGNMVLQQNMKIPVWGWAAPGELVQVSLGANQARTRADAQGNWRVEFAPLPASTTPITMAIGGCNAIQMDGILVGDVWVAAGDINMTYRVMDLPNKGQDVIAQANDPLLHFYEATPIPAIRPAAVGNGYWHPPAQPWIPNTSAVAYFFGQQLRQKLNCPIGVIALACGMPIQSFMSKEALGKIPGSEKALADIAAREAIFPHDPAQQKAAMDDFGKRMHDWDQNTNHPWIDAENAWAKARDAAIAAKQPVPPEPPPRADPPKNPNGEVNEVTTLYNGMVAPIAGLPICGVVWYGTGNPGDTQPQAEALLRGLIADWRGAWKNDFPFLIVDPANFGQRTPNPTDGWWQEARGAQIAVATSTPKAGLAQAVDIGTGANDGPPDKLDVGKRLTATALHVAYGQNVPYEGPRFASMAVEGNKVRVTYANPGVGLVLAASPYISTDPAYDNPALPLNEPLGFEVAGADKKWVNAKAQIDGSTMLVWSDAVAAPVAVRYAWSSNPPVNLYSKDGFPAEPFRTQDWKVNP